MGELLEVEVDLSALIKQASEGPVLRALQEEVILWYPSTDDERIIDTIDAYSEEGLISELMGWHHLSETDALNAFDLARQAVIQDNDVRIDK